MPDSQNTNKGHTQIEYAKDTFTELLGSYVPSIDRSVVQFLSGKIHNLAATGGFE